MENHKLAIIENDSWLEAVADKVIMRHNRYLDRLGEIENSCGSIVDYANGYTYFGFHYSPLEKGWWFREWLPSAKDVYLFGDFNDWQRTECRLTRSDDGVWSHFFPDDIYSGRIVDQTRYKILVHGDSGFLERIPAYAMRVVEDPANHNYTPVVYYREKPFDWGKDSFKFNTSQPLLIYEAHVGMAQEQERVGSFVKFTRDILPRVKELGYNAIQLMAIAEHPYYGSFGYHVSNFFAPSSRFGTAEDLKMLVKRAHELGIAVVMDLVHSHFVKNSNEGIAGLDGTQWQYSPSGDAGYQPYWDSCNFDYAKPQVEHFLLSNIKYWMEEFHFDGFRFDGVTSMLYRNHGHQDFGGHDSYFGDNVNEAAICYLSLANRLIHEINPNAITVAEDVSGMPGVAMPLKDGGFGFDYRLGMAVPDFWIELLEDIPDEEWDIWRMWNTMNDRLSSVKTIGYAESHDQAMVGDKTIAFRLMDKNMYDSMHIGSENIEVDRGMALHKMIRLFTIATAGQGYLNFMGNEFGHPEWIDFPREGNEWSYSNARRQWSLSKDENLRYHFLEQFDKDMIALVKRFDVMGEYGYQLKMDVDNKTMVFRHGPLVFVFNWHTTSCLPSYTIPVQLKGKYRSLLCSDDKKYGGFGRVDPDSEYYSMTGADDEGNPVEIIKIYNVNRTVQVFVKE